MAMSPPKVGVLISSTGPYAVVARSMLNGVMLASEMLRTSGGPAIELVHADPGGEPARYIGCCAELLDLGIRHVVGCYTSSSRKDVIPLFESHDGLLWYPSHYEGFETSDHVIYTGAVPNQHVIPLIRYLVSQGRKRIFCVGSNYIWAWENNRILRDELPRQGGTILGERYVAIGETDFAKLIVTILGLAPDAVFSTLIGTSAYAFFRAFRAAAETRGIDQARQMPIASCSLSEPELEAIGPEAVDGHLSASVYFSSINTSINRDFVAAHDAHFPQGPAVSADAEASYIATLLLAGTLAATSGGGVQAVREAVGRQVIQAPQGAVWIDAITSHAYLTPRIGRSNKQARFDIVMESRAPERPDPYLVRNSARLDAPGPAIRLVS